MFSLIVTRLINPQIVSPINTYAGGQYANRIVGILINVGMITAVIAFIILFLIGGAQWIMSGGDKQALDNARNKVVNAIIGLLILLLLWIVLQIVNSVFGINIGGIGVPQNSPGPTPVPVTNGICQGTVGSCSCSCLSGYVPASACTGSCSGTCQCVSATVNPGTCQCSLGTVSSSSCNSPYTAACLGSTSCSCLTVPYPSGYSCQNSSQCGSGSFCSTGVDADGDGSTTEGAGTCATGIPDCNDNNAQVFPGQTQYFTVPIAGTTNDFNYDCADDNGDGDQNDKMPTYDCLSTMNTPANYCQTTPLDSSFGHQGWQNYVPACGQSFLMPDNPSNIPYWKDCGSSVNSCTYAYGSGGSWFQFDCQAPTLCATGNDPSSGQPFQSYWSVATDFFSWMFSPTDFSAMPCK